MKKKSLLITLVALTLLSSMLLSSILGVTKAEYFKTLSKKLDLEVMPDMALQYYIYDAVEPGSATWDGEKGIYQDATSFSQVIRMGITDKKYTVGSNTYYTGEDLVYQVKIPVDETGYYTLDFTSYMLGGASGNVDRDFYTINYTYAVGCEVLTHTDTDFYFGGGADNNTPQQFSMADRVFKLDERKSQPSDPLLYADASAFSGSGFTDSVYQWKTLSPFRAENVKLAFKVEAEDVTRGYVIWEWDFDGLDGYLTTKEGRTYRLFVENLSINKSMELDGTTKYRTNNDPYFMFPQTAYLNNMVDGASSNTNGYLAGVTRYSGGRGTYVTEATANSLGMRAECLFDKPVPDTSNPPADSMDNPVSLYIPLKNIYYNKTYKVTFDFSIAKQGKNGPKYNVINGYVYRLDAINNTNHTNWHDYSAPVLADPGTAKPFQSYLHVGATIAKNATEHDALKDDISYNKKLYNGEPLTKYDEVLALDNMEKTTSTSVNDTFSRFDVSNSKDNTIMRNFFNAVWHDEYNGQYKIPWLTFYNTTFSINISGAANTKIEDLFWIWEIDALRYTGFYNIRIDNVRVQEVVDFSSNIESNGFRIGETTISPVTHLDNAGIGRTADDGHTGIDADGRDINAFANYKGRNSTGQNYQARAHAPDKFLVAGNIYAPIVDATRFQVKSDTNPYKIFLTGWAVVDGGVEKYVYSVDGGITWQDMIFNGNSDVSSGNDPKKILTDAENGIDQVIKEQGVKPGGTDWITFDETDATNCRFDDFTLSADLKDYATQANLDIIIAAVPAADISLRCEILRIINFNQIRNYVTFPYDFVSDIKVTKNDTNKTVSYLNAHRLVDEDSDMYKNSICEGVGFTFTRTWSLVDNAPQNTTAYVRMGARSHSYEDIRTAFSDFPVKTTLGITGWAMVEGGVEAYYWSADYGKTWKPCGGTPLTRKLINNTYKENYFDGEKAYPAATGFENPQYPDEMMNKYDFRDSLNGQFSGGTAASGSNPGSGSKLTANLKDYEGQVVDVIFAAKPDGSDVYVPVGRIDNVGVYGEYGTFYTRVHRVTLDRNTNMVPLAVKDHAGKGDSYKLTLDDKWINMALGEESYSFFEPQNVNALNARSYNTPNFDDANCKNFIQSGGKVSIDGYLFCWGGVKEYKFSLDGGVTWTKINDAGADINSNSGDTPPMITYAKRRADANFNIECGKLGDFCCTGPVSNHKNGTDAYYNHALEFNIPALPEGAVRDLLVVAESTKDKLIPVLNIKIKIKNTNNLIHYGYHNITGGSDSSFGTLQSGYFTGEQSLQFTPTQGSRVINRITIPVTEEGAYRLTFNHRIQDAQNSQNAKIEISVLHDEGEYTYFCDRLRQFTSTGTDRNVNSDYIYTIPDASKNEDYRAITATVNVTEGDVKRGYIVLDINYNNLTLGTAYTATINLGEDALVKKTSGFLFDMPLMTAPTGYGNAVFMNTVTTAGDYELTLNPILNPSITKNYFNFDGGEKFEGSYLSVPKTYFNVGEPITVDYKVAGATGSVYMYITSDQICSGGKYGDLYIKQAPIAINSSGTIQFTADTYNLPDTTYGADLVISWKDNIAELDKLRKLPEGEYKIWLINSGSFHPFEVLYNNRTNPTVNHLITEPISIKVIDPANPDISMIHRDNIPYVDQNAVVPTELILDKVVYEQGEKIYFKINGSWVRNRVCILNKDVFTSWKIEASLKANNQTRYAEHGTYYKMDLMKKNNLETENFLNTEGLEPGQYKIVYLFGEYIESAWRHTLFGDPHTNAKSRIITIIDVTILPKDAVGNKVAYTKANGTQDIDLGKNAVPQGIKEPVENQDYTITTLTYAQANAIHTSGSYNNPNVPANSGTVESLQYRFDNYTVRPAEVTYTLTVPADIDNSTCNVAYYTTLENSGASKKFNILCPTYSFRKKSS